MLTWIEADTLLYVISTEYILLLKVLIYFVVDCVFVGIFCCCGILSRCRFHEVILMLSPRSQYIMIICTLFLSAL